MTRFLAACRYLLVIPVIGCVILTAGVVIMGVGRIFTGGVNIFVAGDFGPKASKILSLAVIEPPQNGQLMARVQHASQVLAGLVHARYNSAATSPRIRVRVMTVNGKNWVSPRERMTGHSKKLTEPKTMQ